jgi:histone-lysine N-methyltransferase SUV420H
VHKITAKFIIQICPEVAIRKNRSEYSLACENREDIVSIIKDVAIKQKDPARAVSLLLQVPEFKTFSDNLVSAKHKEDFQRYIRKYVDIYLPDCPFEVFRTARYTPELEAAIRARKDIEKGEITYLCGTQAMFKGDETPDQDDFSITESSRLKIRFRMLGPVRFANHDCEPNARLESNKSSDEVKVIALRKIWTGEEITIFYEWNAFGKDNCDCLCETCKPYPKSTLEKPPYHVVRSMRGEIPLDEPTLGLIKRHHKDLYGWEWPKRM